MTSTLTILQRLRSMPLTQAEIGRRTGIPQPRLCRWEAGQIPVSADDALKLQALLNDSEAAIVAPPNEAA